MMLDTGVLDWIKRETGRAHTESMTARDGSDQMIFLRANGQVTRPMPSEAPALRLVSLPSLEAFFKSCPERWPDLAVLCRPGLLTVLDVAHPASTEKLVDEIDVQKFPAVALVDRKGTTLGQSIEDEVGKLLALLPQLFYPSDDVKRLAKLLGNVKKVVEASQVDDGLSQTVQVRQNIAVADTKPSPYFKLSNRGLWPELERTLAEEYYLRLAQRDEGPITARLLPLEHHSDRSARLAVALAGYLKAAEVTVAVYA